MPSLPGAVAEYRLTPKAREDLVAIWTDGASRWGAARADRYISALADSFALLAELPEMAALRREFAPPLRIHPHGAHLILYVEDAGVVIARVLHGRQDLLTALDG